MKLWKHDMVPQQMQIAGGSALVEHQAKTPKIKRMFGAARKIAIPLSVAATAFAGLTGCDDATIASRNISQAADNFEINRRIVFYNGITDAYMLTIEGRCSLDLTTPKVFKVTCKTGQNEYKKHYLGLSDNVTYFAEQMDGANVSTYRYRVIFKPQTIVPDIDVKGSINDLVHPDHPAPPPNRQPTQGPAYK